MDLVEYSEEVFNDIVGQYEEISSKMMIKDVRYIPISALEGDNVVHRSEKTPWYQNAPLLHTLETMHISSDNNMVDARFPVQTVLRPQNEEFMITGVMQEGLPAGFSEEVMKLKYYHQA